MKNLTLSEQILMYVIENTQRETMDCVSTKNVAIRFQLKTKEAYNLLLALSKIKLITYLEPVNGDNFSCADWIRNNDQEIYYINGTLCNKNNC